MESFEEGAVFDTYSEGYAGGVEDVMKRLIGGSLMNFIDVKVQWLLTDLTRHPLASGVREDQLRLLDFGCGTGEFLQALRQRGFSGQVEGCDASEGMLREAAKRWQCGVVPQLHVVGLKEDLRFASETYDVIVACCVFHHVSPSRRQRIFDQFVRILRPGGRVVVFEHNPRNPLTRIMVKRTEIDRHATLMTATETRGAMSSAGLTNMRLAYMMFFPPRFGWLRYAERFLWRIPLGGQYASVGEKPFGSQRYPQKGTT